MSKYSCDNWSWSLRRCDPKLRDRHDANKENRQPISPLSRLAERVDDSRRWAPIPDRWHNHCEWLVNHHRNLRKRFRRTTAHDRLAGVLTTLKCTRERRRGSDEDESVIGSGSRRKRLRSELEYPKLEPASTWLGSVHPELFQKNSPSPSKVDPFPGEDDKMEVETRKPALEPIGDDDDAEFTNSSGSGESIAGREESSTVTATKGVSRSPSPIDGNFEPEDFRTSTPTTHEKSRRDAKESCSTFNRDSAWKDYVMSHDPILFRSYIETQYPKKSWRYSHQKLAARLGGKYRRSSSGRIRKPPTPKSLRISWNSLDDVVQSEGILRSPLHLLPVLPGDATPPLNTINDHGIDVEGLSSNNSHADADVSDVIGDEIRAIRKDCTKSHQPADDSYLGSDERDDEGGVDPSELSDISLGEDEEKSTDKHGYELDLVSSDDDIDDICRIVDKELIHDDYHPDDILTEISFDILDDLEVDSKYPPNYFRAGFADRAVRRRKMKKATSIINGLDPQARSFRPRYTHEEDIADQRIVKFADRETSDQSQDKEQTEDVCGGGGTKFYPSDVRFNKKERLLKDRETSKALECKNAESEAVITVPVPIPVKKVDPKREKQKKVQDCDSLKSEESEIKEENDDSQQQSPKEETYKAVESEPPVLKTETEHVRDGDKSEKTSTSKPIAKGKAKRQVAHKIPVVMGRRPGKPSQVMGNSNRDAGGRSVSRIPTAGGDDDNGCVVPTRITQLRRVKIRKDEANDEGNVGMEPSGNTCAKETIRTDVDVYDNIVTDPPKNVAIEAKGHMVPTGTKNGIQPHSLQPDTSIRNIDMSQSRHAALMKQRLALLKESHGNGPMREAARPMNLPDRVQEQQDSQGTSRGGEKVETGHRDAELPDVNNNHFVNSASQSKINLAPTFANAESNNGIDKGKRISDYAPGDKQSKVSCKKVHQAKENGPEKMMNAERAPPLPSEQNEARRSGANPLSETGRDNHPPQPLFQNPPQRFQNPPYNMNPNVRPSMHPHLHAIPGNAPLYHQHPPDQPRPFNPGLSAYHHHQMALRAAAMHYYSQQRHMALQRHPGIQPPGFIPAHRHPMNMHPGCRPEWNNMPGPGPPH